METQTSPLGAARARRGLTVEEAAARANLAVDDVKALEENRIYRFPSVGDAVAAALVSAGSLKISEREARKLAGQDVAAERKPRLSRQLVVFALAVCLALAGWFGVRPLAFDDEAANARPTGAPAHVQLPQPWEIEVDVYNGTTIPNAGVRLANRIAGLAYRIGNLGNATRRDYEETRVYFARGGEAIAERLAHQLGVETTALPGGRKPNRLVVIVGRGAR